MRRRRLKKRSGRFSVWLLAVLLSICYLGIGSKIASKKVDIFEAGDALTCKAQVTEIGETKVENFGEGEQGFTSTMRFFKAKILSGKFKGKIVKASQTMDEYMLGKTLKPVEKGDKVMLFNAGDSTEWAFGDYSRMGGTAKLMALYALLLLVLGGIKGLNTLISLVFTVFAVFSVFVPAILGGANIYFLTTLTCVYIIVMTMLITSGVESKSLMTMMGCAFGVSVAALLTLIMGKALQITGITDEHTVYLTQINPENPIDLKALVFGMIVIGAMGAVMDVAMDISSSLFELHTKAPALSFSELFKSGITIGRDIMGTMANTLVLAYIGSSLCSVLLLIAYSSSLYELMNREGIIVELLNAFIGSLAILLTIPLTSFTCAAFYTGKGRPLKKAS